MDDKIIEENKIEEMQTDKINTDVAVKQKKSFLSSFINVALIVLLVVLGARLIFNVFFMGVYVVGDSMMPNFYGAASENDKGGDYVYISKFSKPERGDVVVISVESNGQDVAIIKRVIGLEGDSLYLYKGKLYVKYAGADDFVLVEEDYIDEQYNNPNLSYNSTNIITVPENCVYVLGDNRNISKDSRDKEYGCFDLNDVYGVIPDWSLEYKQTISDVYNFFKI